MLTRLASSVDRHVYNLFNLAAPDRLPRELWMVHASFGGGIFADLRRQTASSADLRQNPLGTLSEPSRNLPIGAMCFPARAAELSRAHPRRVPLRRAFGFQHESALNQTEHLLLLLANVSTREPDGRRTLDAPRVSLEPLLQWSVGSSRPHLPWPSPGSGRCTAG